VSLLFDWYVLEIEYKLTCIYFKVTQ